MSRWIARALLAIGGVAVLVLGAAANGFEPSLSDVSPSTSTTRTSTEPPRRAAGLALRVSVVKLLVDPADESAAVVVHIANPNPRRALMNAPIAIELVDRAGSVVGTSAAAGTDPLLVHVPYVDPGGTALFVSDNIATSALPTEARARATASFSAVRRARLEVRSPRLRRSPFGWVADATLVGAADASPRDVLVQAVVQRDGDVVAAGTTVVAAPSRGRPAGLEILLIGDAKGGELRVWAPPQ